MEGVFIGGLQHFSIEPVGGEFSVSNYSPVEDSDLYMNTLLDLFERKGWSWFYHSYEEADIWNPQMSLTKKVWLRTPHPKKYLLLKAHFKLNDRFQAAD